MSTLRATNLKGGSAGSAPNFPDGAVITGVATVGVLSATTFYGSGANLTGIDATALKDGGGSVKVQANSDGAVVTGVITATTGSFTGNVSVGGTLTYEDVTNIDSVGLITARNGVKVLAGGINAVGVVTATSFEGSGANLTGIDALPSLTGNAYGNIAAGKAVQIRSDGQGIEQVVSQAMGWGEEFLINGNEAVTSYRSSSMTMIAENKYALVYVDSSANCYGRICTLDPLTLVVTMGTPQAFDVNGSSTYPDVAWDPKAASNDGRLLVMWMRGSDIKARMCSISGTTFTLAPGLASPASSVSFFGGVVYEPYQQKFLINYNGNTTGSGNLIGRILHWEDPSNTDTWISIHGAQTIGNNGSNYNRLGIMCPMFKTLNNNNHSGFVGVLFQNNQSGTSGTWYQTVNISGNTMYFNGSQDKLDSMDMYRGFGFGMVKGSDNTEYFLCLVVYIHTGDNAGNYELLQISTNGSQTTRNTGAFTANGDPAQYMSKYIPYDPFNKRFVLTYLHMPSGGTNQLVSQFVSVDPATSWTPTFSARTVIDDSTTSVRSMTSIATQGEGSQYQQYPTNGSGYGSNDVRIITTFQDDSNNDYLTSAVLRPSTTTNLTESFVGFADTSYTNGQTAKVKVVGNQLTQAGLTTGAKHYVQLDGSVGTTAQTPSVEAGRAITGNTLLIQPQ